MAGHKKYTLDNCVNCKRNQSTQNRPDYTRLKIVYTYTSYVTQDVQTYNTYDNRTPSPLKKNIYYITRTTLEMCVGYGMYEFRSNRLSRVSNRNIIRK